MRSRTSFFNTTVFAKGMARFWPVWGAYFGVWLIILPIHLLSLRNYASSPASVKHLILGNGIATGVVMALVFGGLAAMAVWSFLYTSRSAYGTACLPLRRESLFFSNCAAGLVPLLAANVLIALLSALAAAGTLGAGAAFGAAAQWCGAVSLTVLFFFGFATLCAQLTGSVIIMPLVYIVLNFTAYVVETLARSVMRTFVYGFSGNVGGLTPVARWLSPVIALYNRIGASPVYEEFAEGSEVYERIIDYSFYGWGTIAVYAAVGVVFLALALLLLRKRRMETAGEVVAVPPLKPVFRWCMALGCGLVLATIMYGSMPVYSPEGAFIEMLAFMIVGAFIGWFAARMLLLKSFRAFRGGWAGFGLCCAVILALMLGMRFDLFGYERYVPAEEKIESVWISAGGEFAQLKEPENIARAREIHGSVIAHKGEYTRDSAWNGRYYGNFRIVYSLGDGGEVQRQYDLRYDPENPHGDVVALQELLNVPEAIAWRKRTDIPLTEETVVYGTVDSTLTAVEYGYYNSLFSSPGAVATGTANTSDKYYRNSVTLSAEEAWELYSTCIVPDFEDGSLGKVWILQGEDYERSVYDASVSIVAERETAEGYIGHDYIRTTPTVDSWRTNAWLAAHGIAMHLVGETEY